MMRDPFGNSAFVFGIAVLLRILLLFYGLFQDAYSPVKYTDIDYYVFTDAARFVSQGRSPYERETYRYTPMLAWMLLPTTWSQVWFSFGKVIFAVGDLVAGWLIVLVLRSSTHIGVEAALKFAAIWLLNPIVATISTRGSSEGLLGALVIALLWAVTQRRAFLAGFLLGLGVHFKIYPFIYAPSIIWWLDDEHLGLIPPKSMSSGWDRICNFCNAARLKVAFVSLGTFLGLNFVMYMGYGFPFLQHTYLHHVTRIDHRHNFSPYNTLLYYNSSKSGLSYLPLESLAFAPQILLSAVILPLLLAKKDLPSTMLAQTFAFVSFNKVCTSQYFLWYIVFLPFYLPVSSLLACPKLGFLAAVFWILSQGLWLQQGFQLEFNGKTTFVPGLWMASLLFFIVNIWILGIVVTDVGRSSGSRTRGFSSAVHSNI